MSPATASPYQLESVNQSNSSKQTPHIRALSSTPIAPTTRAWLLWLQHMRIDIARQSSYLSATDCVRLLLLYANSWLRWLGVGRSRRRGIWWYYESHSLLLGLVDLIASFVVWLLFVCSGSKLGSWLSVRIGFWFRLWDMLIGIWVKSGHGDLVDHCLFNTSFVIFCNEIR